jgi:hypothetical protein
VLPGRQQEERKQEEKEVEELSDRMNLVSIFA